MILRVREPFVAVKDDGSREFTRLTKGSRIKLVTGKPDRTGFVIVEHERHHYLVFKLDVDQRCEKVQTEGK